jgi:hypothetical protein
MNWTAAKDEVMKAAIAPLSAVGGLLWYLFRRVNDRRRVVAWLRLNSEDSPGQSHLTTVEIAKGMAITEDRVRAACMSAKEIFRYESDKELWSIWRQEPQSVYATRGLLTL